MVEVVTIRKLFTARTTPAESSALVVRNCHAAKLGRVYGPRSCNSNNRSFKDVEYDVAPR